MAEINRDDFYHWIVDELRLALERHLLYKNSGGNNRLAPHVIQEVVQDALFKFVETLNAPDKFDCDRNKVRAWIYTVADRGLIDRFRQGNRRPTIPIDALIEATLATPEPGLDADQTREVLQAFLQLTPDEQQALTGVSEGLGRQEIAEEMQIPLTKVDYFLRNGRKKMSGSTGILLKSRKRGR
jgi:RNA polymerase sigma factor (sigma-70 family)